MIELSSFSVFHFGPLVFIPSTSSNWTVLWGNIWSLNNELSTSVFRFDGCWDDALYQNCFSATFSIINGTQAHRSRELFTRITLDTCLSITKVVQVGNLIFGNFLLKLISGNKCLGSIKPCRIYLHIYGI